jgi:hypothetical protein
MSGVCEYCTVRYAGEAIGAVLRMFGALSR